MRSENSHKSGTSVWPLGEGRLKLKGQRAGWLDSDGHKSTDSKRLAQAHMFINVDGPALGYGKQSPATGNHKWSLITLSWGSRR